MDFYRNQGDDKFMASYGLFSTSGKSTTLSCPSGTYVSQFWDALSGNNAGPFVLNYHYMGGGGQHPTIWQPYGWAYVAETTAEDRRAIPKRSMAKRPSNVGLMTDIARFGTMRVPAIEYLRSPAPGVGYLGGAPVSHPVANDPYTSDGENALFVDNHVSWRSPTLVVSTGRYSIYYGEITW